jgi:hypothetical protein
MRVSEPATPTWLPRHEDQDAHPKRWLQTGRRQPGWWQNREEVNRPWQTIIVLTSVSTTRGV